MSAKVTTRVNSRRALNANAEPSSLPSRRPRSQLHKRPQFVSEGFLDELTPVAAALCKDITSPSTRCSASMNDTTPRRPFIRTLCAVWSAGDRGFATAKLGALGGDRVQRHERGIGH